MRLSLRKNLGLSSWQVRLNPKKKRRKGASSFIMELTKHDQQASCPCSLMIRVPIMRQPPTYTTWKITCRSSDEVQALQQWLSSRIDLDRIMTDTVRVAPNGVEQVETVPHQLGDFSAIRLLPNSQANPASFRLVFHRRPDAGRFWKDLMVNILQEIETTPPKASIEVESKGEMEPISPATGPS